MEVFLVHRNLYLYTQFIALISERGDSAAVNITMSGYVYNRKQTVNHFNLPLYYGLNMKQGAKQDINSEIFPAATVVSHISVTIRNKTCI
jgi:hypothetical protein